MHTDYFAWIDHEGRIDARAAARAQHSRFVEPTQQDVERELARRYEEELLAEAAIVIEEGAR